MVASTFAGNRVTNHLTYSGVLGGLPQPTVVGCVFWDNVGDSGQAADMGSSLNTVSWSLFEDVHGVGGVGNIDADPLFVDAYGADGLAGTLDDDLRLGPGSAAVDAGSNAGLPADVHDLDLDGDLAEPLPLDARGLPRRADDPTVGDTGEGLSPVVDMGAHERS